MIVYDKRGWYSEPMIIQVIGKAAAVLEVLGSSDATSFSDVWRVTGLNKTTVAHLLETLQQVGYVEKTLDGRYRLGPQILELAQRRLRRVVLREAAEAHALALAGEIGATVTVAALEAGERHKLAKANGDGGPVLDDTSERRVDLYATATGRVLLAFASEAERELCLARYGLPGERWPQVADEAELAAALEVIRERSMATVVSADGRTEAIAVPVTGPDGRVWAAIGSSTLPAGSGESAGEQRVEILRKVARELTEDLRLRLGEGGPRPPAEA